MDSEKKEGVKFEDQEALNYHADPVPGKFRI